MSGSGDIPWEDLIEGRCYEIDKSYMRRQFPHAVIQDNHGEYLGKLINKSKDKSILSGGGPTRGYIPPWYGKFEKNGTITIRCQSNDNDIEGGGGIGFYFKEVECIICKNYSFDIHIL